MNPAEAKMAELRLKADQLEIQINNSIEQFEQNNNLVILPKLENRRLKIGMSIELKTLMENNKKSANHSKDDVFIINTDEGVLTIYKSGAITFISEKRKFHAPLSIILEMFDEWVKLPPKEGSIQMVYPKEI